MSLRELFKWLPSILLTGVIAALIGAWLESRRETRQRRHGFAERQLRELYSPMLACRMEVEAIYATHRAVEQARTGAWRELCDQAGQTPKREENLERLNSERGPAFARISDGDNRQVGDQVTAAYQRMAKIFQDGLWLAEAETRKYVGLVVEHAKLCERISAREIPHEVVQRLRNNQRELLPFFKEIQLTHDRLRKQVSKGRG